MDRQTILITLRRVPLFQDLSDAELVLLAKTAVVRTYPHGAVIFQVGTPVADLLIVESGEVHLLQVSAEGREQVLTVERKGGSLGEIAAIDGGTQPFSARAVTSVRLICIPVIQFRDFCLTHPDVALKLMKLLARRCRNLVNLVERLSFTTVRTRVVAYLLEEGAVRGERAGQGLRFELRENNQQIAARLGTVRELVSRTMGRLCAEGLISMRKKTVTIPKLNLLESDVSALIRTELTQV